MIHSRKVAFLLAVALVLWATCLVAADKKKKKAAPAPATAPMEESKRALHALNRLSFGPRPGEVERVAARGVDRWIEEQLHPERIDDAALEARLVNFRTLKMDARQMVENFPPPQVLKAVADGRLPLPADPNAPPRLNVIAGLILGSPEFQRR